jgi:hypothetical protein
MSAQASPKTATEQAVDNRNRRCYNLMAVQQIVNLNLTLPRGWLTRHEGSIPFLRLIGVGGHLGIL